MLDTAAKIVYHKRVAVGVTPQGIKNQRYATNPKPCAFWSGGYAVAVGMSTHIIANRISRRM